jgi:hypothetical protein
MEAFACFPERLSTALLHAVKRAAGLLREPGGHPAEGLDRCEGDTPAAAQGCSFLRHYHGR